MSARITQTCPRFPAQPNRFAGSVGEGHVSAETIRPLTTASHRRFSVIVSSLAFAVAAACGSGASPAADNSTSPTTSQMVLRGVGNLTAVGVPGQNFAVHSVTYEVEAQGEGSLSWVVTASEPWITTSVSGGTLDENESVQVEVSFATLASSLPIGVHHGEVVFANSDDPSNAAQRSVILTISPSTSQPMTSATRVSGPAPLSVVFDPIGASSGVNQPPGSNPNHAEFAYAWEFGNPAAGNWLHTGRPKNRSTAWIGAHVYEAPGTYRATLRVIDAQGNEFDYHQDITVTDPDTVFSSRTFYVAANGNDANPGTQGAPFRTAQRGLQAAFSTSGAARLRFNRGDSFVSSSGWSISNATGPYQIDAYGSGNRPRIVFSGTDVGMSLQGSHDLRVCDLDVVSTSTTQAAWATGVSAGTQTLVSGCTFASFGFGLGSNGINELCAYDCEFLDSSQYGIYLFGADDTSAIHLAVLGSRLNVAGQHLIRTYMSRSVIQSNSFQNAGYSSLKLVGRPLPNPSRYVCVVDNDIRSEVTDPLGIGPEGSTYDQHATDYLVEGNYFYSRQPGNSCMQVRGYDITVRNNVFDVANRRAVNVTRWGIGPMPANIVIEHNTAVGVGPNLYFVLADSSNPTVVRNNLFYCPNGTVETPAGSVTTMGNLTPSSNPFTPMAGLLGGEFALTTAGANAAVNAGVPCSVRYDFAGQPRLSNSSLDVGAFERQ